MERIETQSKRSPLPRYGSSWLGVCGLLMLLLGGSGCSLFVMGGKMLMGDPMVEADFERFTGKSLASEGMQVAVICTTPEAVRSDFSSLDIDLLSGLTRRLARAKIEVVPPHKVATWIDDTGGDLSNMTELGQELDADFIVHVHIDSFAYKEPNAPDLYRGRTTGTVVVWEIVNGEGYGDLPTDPQARTVYSKPFSSVFPAHRPIPAHDTSEGVFRKRFVDRLSDELARLFYEHKAGSDF